MAHGTAGLVLLLVASCVMGGHGDEESKHDEGLLARQEAWSKCDRHRSRQARAILNEEVYPVVEKQSYTLPSSCPLSKSQDMYLDNEMVILPTLDTARHFFQILFTASQVLPARA